MASPAVSVCCSCIRWHKKAYDLDFNRKYWKDFQLALTITIYIYVCIHVAAKRTFSGGDLQADSGDSKLYLVLIHGNLYNRY